VTCVNNSGGNSPISIIRIRSRPGDKEDDEEEEEEEDERTTIVFKIFRVPHACTTCVRVTLLFLLPLDRLVLDNDDQLL
jgi:hypothetical protein